MIFRVNVCRVDACFLECSLYSLLNLFLLCLLGSNLLLALNNVGRNSCFVKRYRLHSSNLHSNGVTLLCCWLVCLYHCAESVLVHMVVNLHISALEEEIAVKLHLLTGDTGTMLNSCFCIVAACEHECLDFVETLAFVCNSSVENLLNECDKVLTCCNEVSLTLHCDHCCEVVSLLYKQTTV